MVLPFLFECPPEVKPPEITLTIGEQGEDLKKECFGYKGCSRWDMELVGLLELEQGCFSDTMRWWLLLGLSAKYHVFLEAMAHMVLVCR